MKENFDEIKQAMENVDEVPACPVEEEKSKTD